MTVTFLIESIGLSNDSIWQGNIETFGLKLNSFIQFIIFRPAFLILFQLEFDFALICLIVREDLEL